MKRIVFIFSFIIFSFFFSSFSSAYQEILIEERDGKPIRVIKVALDGEHYVVASVAKDGGETLEELTKKVGGVSAINGAFFCPKDYGYCNGQTFSNYERIFQGDGASYSKFWPDTSVRGIFGFNQSGNPLFVQNKISTHDVGLDSNINSNKIGELYFGISNFPVLLINGEDVTVGASEYIDSKLTGKGNRNFICSTQDGKTIYMGYVGLSSVWDMASYIRKNFGCYNALSLDAGASSAMVYSGNVLEKGERRLITDAFVVVPKASFVNLGGEVLLNLEAVQPEYSLTVADQTFISKIDKIIDAIYSKYGKATYKTKLISMFRKEINSGKLDARKKSVYNQVLQYLFTIEKL